LGWTLIGWVAALVWSVTAESPSTQIAQQQPVLCANCGKYSLPVSQFCSSCGTRF
jgi:uncharacterized OB-fold protein